MLDAVGFAVLATQRDGQPHTSLVAITPVDGVRKLLFATYRSTRKYHSLSLDGRVSLFLLDPTAGAFEAQRTVLSAHGLAAEAPVDRRTALASLHAARHPFLCELLRSEDTALICVDVAAYQLVRGIDDACWYDLSNRSTGGSPPAQTTSPLGA